MNIHHPSNHAQSQQDHLGTLSCSNNHLTSEHLKIRLNWKTMRVTTQNYCITPPRGTNYDTDNGEHMYDNDNDSDSSNKTF